MSKGNIGEHSKGTEHPPMAEGGTNGNIPFRGVPLFPLPVRAHLDQQARSPNVVAHPAADWLILQCSASKTLDLAKSLTEAGYEAWAPITREERRSEDQRTREEVAVPLMPSFVFARACHLHPLLALVRSPSLQYRIWDSEQRKMVTRGHPRFRIFRADRFIADRELDPLRRLEKKPRPKRVERTFALGQRVRTDEAGFQGLTGTVVAIIGKKVSVAFPKWAIDVLFPTWALRELDAPAAVNVNTGSPERDAA
jgi:transcription antitermination factor NusG